MTLADACNVQNEFQRAIDSGVIDRDSMIATQSRIENFLEHLPQHPVCEIDSTILDAHAQLAKTLAQNTPFSEFLFSPEGFE